MKAFVYDPNAPEKTRASKLMPLIMHHLAKYVHAKYACVCTLHYITYIVVEVSVEGKVHASVIIIVAKSRKKPH